LNYILRIETTALRRTNHLKTVLILRSPLRQPTLGRRGDCVRPRAPGAPSPCGIPLKRTWQYFIVMYLYVILYNNIIPPRYIVFSFFSPIAAPDTDFAHPCFASTPSQQCRGPTQITTANALCALPHNIPRAHIRFVYAGVLGPLAS